MIACPGRLVNDASKEPEVAADLPPATPTATSITVTIPATAVQAAGFGRLRSPRRRTVSPFTVPATLLQRPEIFYTNSRQGRYDVLTTPEHPGTIELLL